MKPNIFLILICTFFCSSKISFAKSFQESFKDSTATVYFFRTSDMGALINFKYYIDGEYVGKFNYGKYMKLELEPGEHLIFAKAENIAFLKTDLKAGKTYVVNSLPRMGGLKASVKIAQVTIEDTRWIKRIRKHLNNKKLVSFTVEELEHGQQKSTNMLRRARKKYQRFKVNNIEIPMLSQPFPKDSLIVE